MRNLALLSAATLAACLAAGIVAAAEAPLPAHPVRVVSMNLCADELVLRLADRDQIAAVTWLARDPRGSSVFAEAAGVPLTRGLSEEVIALKPDLVIAGAFTTRSAVGMLKRIGMPMLELGLPGDFEGVRAQIRTVAKALGHPDRGEALVADLDRGLETVAAAPRPLRALVMRPNGFTVAPGSLGDAVIRAAGLVNVAAEIGRDRSGQVPLEAAAFAEADLIVLDDSGSGTPSLADALLHHPVLEQLRREGRTVSIPNRLWNCPGSQVAEVVKRLAKAARERTVLQ
ncbi:ABC transporter substrate-binding protein [Methylobacterium brachythecii]|uniref:Cobalamin ABC transporter substrate-binding protein n=1 Tax=Methylobacterium brachythecii TaxID=1176177 RepID=A0A7W6F6B7_9HYPH|nr:ABC transporter substrate-binding protein [Methylobacterium brachythecii]MBB3902209.1 iron complex transport system substrate-binding protein [Methylobacterium brachythecii]GLS42055.1 cobalamin ABC transporter substrate-binding protein [Methylobacterium brachythecii]